MSDTTAVPGSKCPYCGMMPHQGVCPKVRAIEYHQDGTVKRVEFHELKLFPGNAGCPPRPPDFDPQVNKHGQAMARFGAYGPDGKFYDVDHNGNLVGYGRG